MRQIPAAACVARFWAQPPKYICTTYTYTCIPRHLGQTLLRPPRPLPCASRPGAWRVRGRGRLPAKAGVSAGTAKEPHVARTKDIPLKLQKGP